MVNDRAAGESHSGRSMSAGAESPWLLKALAWVVLAVMAAATVYTGWIALVNVNRIGV